jgi:hypothetical protein
MKYVGKNWLFHLYGHQKLTTVPLENLNAFCLPVPVSKAVLGQAVHVYAMHIHAAPVHAMHAQII